MEERRQRLFENRVLRGIFGPKRDKVTRDWRKLHSEELNDLYSTSIVWVIKLRRMESAGHVARMEEEERPIKGFGAETCGKETTWKTQT